MILFPGFGTPVFSRGVDEHPDCHAGNDAVADYAPEIGNLAEEDKSESRGKDNLRIVIDLNFPRGRVGISGCDGELPAGRG